MVGVSAPAVARGAVTGWNPKVLLLVGTRDPIMRQAGLVNLGWIRTDNLRPLLAELSLLVGYGFDDSDWIAVEHGIRGTDSEAGPWFEYPVGRIGTRLALEPGADEMVSVQLDGASKSEQQKIRWLGDIMRNWNLSDPGRE